MNARIVPILAVLVLAMAPVVLADDAELKKQVKEKVEILNEATIKGDYAVVADLTHPKVIEMAGGRDKIIDLMEKTIGQLKKQGIGFKSFKVGDSSDIVKQGESLYLYVPFELTMKVPSAKVISSGYVIGVSTDTGKSWTFVNSNTDENIKKILPDLPASLKLPELKKPVVEKD